VSACAATGRCRPAWHGFSLVEMAVAVAALAALLYFLLDRVLYMQERGEKADVEETVRTIDYALRLEAASRLARGPESKRPPLEQENPVKWLQTPPRNYLGEFDKPPAKDKAPCWYFDSAGRQLAYRPNRAEHLRIDGRQDRELRFAVGNDGSTPFPRLISRISYTWF